MPKPDKPEDDKIKVTSAKPIIDKGIIGGSPPAPIITAGIGPKVFIIVSGDVNITSSDQQVVIERRQI